MPGTMLRSRAGEPDGMAVLHDVERVLGLPEDDALALSLWLAVRRVLLWASLPAEERAGLLGAGAAPECLVAAREQAPELAGALDTFAALWVEPERMEPGRLAGACNEVGRWATRWGLERTAVMFAEAAAAVEAGNAARAIEAGETCQRLGGTEMWQRAEQWFQRAFGLARVAKHGRQVLSIRALLAYGNWAREMGKYALARWCYVKAARRARRYNKRMYYAIAHHNLLGLAVLAGWDFHEAEAYAQAALDYYPRSDARLPHLAHDYAALLNRHRLFSSAFRILKPLPQFIERAEVQPIVYGSLAWAAAGMGRRDAYEEAVRSALPLASLYSEFAAYAFLYLAEGALLLDERVRAREYAQTAVRFATDRSDAVAIDAAQQFLARVEQGGRVRPAAAVTPAHTEHLATAFAVRLGQPTQSAGVDPEPASEPVEVFPRRRSHTICPAPKWGLWGDPDTIAGLMVLQEVECSVDQQDDSLALLLWRTLRCVRSWAASGAEERVNLFTKVPASEANHSALLRPRVPALNDAFAVFHALLEIPQHIQAGQLADACNEVGRWASARGAAQTAVLFAEVAGHVEPENAARAIEAGETCQQLGGLEMWHRAEQWFQRAFGLARVATHSRRLLSIRALLAYGNWARETGAYTLARKCYEKAARRARRHARWTYYAIAHHNLLGLAVLAGWDFHEAEAYAQAALDYYPRSDARLPHLAHDYAALLNRRRLYSFALQILRLLPWLIQQPEVRPIVYGSLAWAAAGADRRELYQEAVRAATPLIPLYGQFAPYALLYVAEGTLLSGDRVSAAAQAEKARQSGIQRGDEYATAAASALLARIDNSEPAPSVAEVPAQASTVWLVRRFQARLTHRAFQPR